jgi:hypothetical protein
MKCNFKNDLVAKNVSVANAFWHLSQKSHDPSIPKHKLDNTRFISSGRVENRKA